MRQVAKKVTSPTHKRFRVAGMVRCKLDLSPIELRLMMSNPPTIWRTQVDAVIKPIHACERSGTGGESNRLADLRN